MIPKSSFAPWIAEYHEGMEVEVASELSTKDNPKLNPTSLYGTVIYEDKKYSFGLSLTAYNKIARNQAFGSDTKEWIGKKLRYLGMEKTARGGKAHIWEGVEPEISLTADSKAPF